MAKRSTQKYLSVWLVFISYLITSWTGKMQRIYFSICIYSLHLSWKLCSARILTHVMGTEDPSLTEGNSLRIDCESKMCLCPKTEAGISETLAETLLNLLVGQRSHIAASAFTWAGNQRLCPQISFSNLSVPWVGQPSTTTSNCVKVYNFLRLKRSTAMRDNAGLSHAEHLRTNWTFYK